MHSAMVQHSFLGQSLAAVQRAPERRAEPARLQDIIRRGRSEILPLGWRVENSARQDRTTLHEFMSRERMSVLQRDIRRSAWPWGEEYTATTLSSSSLDRIEASGVRCWYRGLVVQTAVHRQCAARLPSAIDRGLMHPCPDPPPRQS